MEGELDALELTIYAPSGAEFALVQYDDGRVLFGSGCGLRQFSLHFRFDSLSSIAVTASVDAAGSDDEETQLWLVIVHLFTFGESFESISVRMPTELYTRCGLSFASEVVADEVTSTTTCTVPRELFFQTSIPSSADIPTWLGRCLTTVNTPAYPVSSVVTSTGDTPPCTVLHPLRPPKPRPGALLYQRWIPSLSRVLTLRNVDIDKHTSTFSAWMNNDRVAEFWGMRGDAATVHAPYLRALQADRHASAVIGALGDVDFLYVEMYYVTEDHVAPYVPAPGAGAHDRGFHLLVGNEQLRGPHMVHAWLPSVVHCLFLEDPRTGSVYLEPRADNAKLIGYLIRLGFTKVREFEFPHKRAALMQIRRDEFFRGFKGEQGGFRLISEK
ncbi:acyl-CoA N-acyltransferase [Limtongia smithiae]|uniref:acyl-CoA N-acyltransferase n=1 Tax=Limtongia smithiae TaxID=1125753 RepID=UPI0034CE5805